MPFINVDITRNCCRCSMTLINLFLCPSVSFALNLKLLTINARFGEIDKLEWPVLNVSKSDGFFVFRSKHEKCGYYLCLLIYYSHVTLCFNLICK
jgi:hypothetical protein